MCIRSAWWQNSNACTSVLSLTTTVLSTHLWWWNLFIHVFGILFRSCCNLTLNKYWGFRYQSWAKKKKNSAFTQPLTITDEEAELNRVGMDSKHKKQSHDFYLKHINLKFELAEQYKNILTLTAESTDSAVSMSYK